MEKLLMIFCALLFISSCTTIAITEREVFDAHKTITPQQFNYSQYTLHELILETDDGETLNSWFLEHEDAAATVLYLGGNGFLMVKSAPLIDAYSSIPVNLMMFDYRGYGLSSGEPSVDGIQKDAKTAYRFIKNDSPSPTDRIYVHGHSMGSFLSAYLTDTEDVSGYVMESPITEVSGWTRGLVPWILRPFVRFDIDNAIKEQNNIDRVTGIDKPLLIIGGSDDEITPFKMAEKLEEVSGSSQKRLVKITGGTHNDLPTYMSYRIALEQFLID